MTNERCSYGANCICVNFPTEIELIKCGCTKYNSDCNALLHHMCQTTFAQQYGVDDLEYKCHYCMNHSLLDQGIDMLMNDFNSCDTNTKNPDSTVDNSNNNIVSVEDSNNNNISNNISIDDLNACDPNVITTDSRVADSNNNNNNVSIEEKNDGVADDQNVSTPSPKKRPATTSWNSNSKKQKKKNLQCKKGARVKVRRNNLFHILPDPEQKKGMEKYGNSRNFHGDIVSGNGKSGYQIRFDDLPSGKQIVYVKRRNIISVVDRGEEEKEYDHYVEELQESHSKKDPVIACMVKCQREFQKLDDEVVIDAKKFDMLYEDENKIEKKLEWEIVAETEECDLGGVDFDLDVSWKKYCNK